MNYISPNEVTLCTH